MDAANILKPALARGELHTIGATTLKEYRKYFEKDAALQRRWLLVRFVKGFRNAAYWVSAGQGNFMPFRVGRLPGRYQSLARLGRGGDTELPHVGL